MTQVIQTTPYDPAAEVVKALREEQTITIYFPPRFIMSPRIRLYRPEDIQTFKGYLKGVEFEGVENGEVDAPISAIVFDWSEADYQAAKAATLFSEEPSN